MKIRFGDLKKIIHEEYMRGVPEFVLREVTHQYVEEIRKHVQRHILATKKSPNDSREAIDTANDILKQLEIEANELLEAKLWQFMQRT